MGAMQRAAVVDMGSNSFRLVVYGYEPGRWWQHVGEIREAVRVGAGVGDDGMLQPEPMERALRTAKLFSAFCRASGIDVGGGSVQLMRIEGRRMTASGSWPLGAVRLSERFLPGDEAGGKALKAARKHVRATLAD